MIIERIAGTLPRITVTKDRVSVKIPSAYSSDNLESVIKFAQIVVSELGPVPQSLRGTIHFNGHVASVDMKTEARVVIKTIEGPLVLK